MDNSSSRKPIAKIITRKMFHCPHCRGLIPDELIAMHIGKHPAPELSCPHCQSPFKAPAAKKKPIKSPDERSEKRCQVSIKVKYESQEDFKAKYTKNVSKGGMFLQTGTPYEKGTRVALYLCIPSLKDPLKVVGEVVRNHFFGISDKEKGVGIKFIEIDKKSKNQLAGFLRELDTCK